MAKKPYVPPEFPANADGYPQPYADLGVPVGALYSFCIGWPISANVYLSKSKRWRSSIGRVWADTTARFVYRQLGGVRTDVPGAMRPPDPLIGRVGLWFEVWPPDDNRTRDLDNFTGKHIQDFLTYIKIWGDDAQIKERHEYWRTKWNTGCVWVHTMEI